MPLATMAAFMPAENQAITPVLFNCSAIMTSAPNHTRVSQALFSDSTSSQSMVPVIINTNKPTKATTVASSENVGSNSMAGTFAHSNSSKAKVPSMTFSDGDSGPMLFNSALA